MTTLPNAFALSRSPTAGFARRLAQRSVVGVSGATGKLGAPACALVGVVALTLVLVALQPWGEPWWYTADSDGAYLANGLNLLLGNKTKMLDHPGVPMQALLTLSLAVDYVIHGWGEGLGVLDYVDACFADPDCIIALTALWGLVFLLGAVVVAYEVGRHMFGHWHWGVVSACLYLALPGHLTFATMFRPENILSGSCLLSAYLLWRGLERRSPSCCLLAALVIGHAVGEKVHAIGMLLPLALTVMVLLRVNWVTLTVLSVVGSTRRCRTGVLCGAAIWLVCLIILNLGREPTVLDWKLFALVGLTVAYLILSIWVVRRFAQSRLVSVAINPAYVLTAVALGVGLMVPSMLLLDETRPLFWQLVTLLSGRGVNTGMSVAGVMTGLGVLGSRLLDTGMLPFVGLIGIGALYIFRRGRRHDALWLVAALGMLVPALGRSSASPSPHYLAPALVLLIPLVIRVLQSPHVDAAAVPARRSVWLVLVLVVAGPYALCVKQTWTNVARAEHIAAACDDVLTRLEPGEAILMNYGAMNRQANHFRFMSAYADYVPVFPSRCFPDLPRGIDECYRQGKRPAYYVMAPGSGRPQVEPTAGERAVATNAWGERFEVEPVATYTGGPIPLEAYRITRHLPR